MSNAYFKVRKPLNEPVLSYAPGTPERAALKAALEDLKKEVLEIPVIINGKAVYTGNTRDVVMPQDKNHVLARFHQVGEKELRDAIDAAMAAKTQWEEMPWEHRAAIFLKAAELLSGPWRAKINAATMLGQGKTAHQAEIDSACELTDFLRFNAYYMSQIYKDQPESTANDWNRVEYRPLEGFVLAITPFNFTAIGGNLPTSPAMMGNTVLWKPATTAVLSNYLFMQLLMEAGLPPGVINFVPGSGSLIGRVVFSDENFCGFHFTGSTGVFNNIWKTIGNNIDNYRSYPRLVGETGGKDFVFAHPTANRDQLVTALVRGSFEYQGQKCSAASRAYIPQSMWPEVKEKLVKQISTIKVGRVEDFTNYMSAVIDEAAFDSIKGYIDYAKASDKAEILIGGKCDKSVGFFIDPTVIVTTDPHFKTLVEEIFGPVLTIYVYEDDKLAETLELCDTASPYGLTGAIFSQCRYAVVEMEKALRHAAGNFYINDKPTGAVVGQQPFGGGRVSGTNDKAGSAVNLMRWVSLRTIKENFNPPTSYEYPFMKEK